MKRNKMTVEISATLSDELGCPAGKITIDEVDGDKISADAEHGEHVIALRRALKAAYQRWLEASDDELTEACEKVLMLAAERSALGEGANE
jgi:hypothetical protein